MKLRTARPSTSCSPTTVTYSMTSPTLNSRAEIAAAFQGRNMYGHLTTNIVIEELARDSAQVHSKYIAFAQDGGIQTGDYFDAVIRTDAGWRLKVRKAVPRTPSVFVET
ncbi:MAG: hypothetical protein E6G39_11390 [Actinobacteria bacterium]|nr:MAG: hypothetical protein E6G39_11390 [Actinomycetota bacterium]